MLLKLLICLSLLEFTIPMFASKPSETGVDVVTCKMSKNTDKKLDVSSLLGTLLFVETFICHPRSLHLPALAPPTSHTSFYFLLHPSPFFKKYTYQCLPTCVCQKLVWTLEFSPQLRTNTKTTKICEIWIENKLMDEKCMWTCASIANQVYASQGTDPDLCPQIERENAQVTGGAATKLDYKLLEFSSSSSISLRSNPKRTPTKTKTSTAKTTTTRTIPSFAPPTEYYTSMKDSVDVHE